MKGENARVVQLEATRAWLSAKRPRENQRKCDYY